MCSLPISSVVIALFFAVGCTLSVRTETRRRGERERESSETKMNGVEGAGGDCSSLSSLKTKRFVSDTEMARTKVGGEGR